MLEGTKALVAKTGDLAERRPTEMTLAIVGSLMSLAIYYGLIPDDPKLVAPLMLGVAWLATAVTAVVAKHRSKTPA